MASRFAQHWNPDNRGSRFTGRAAVAILSRAGGKSRFDIGEDTGNAEETIKSVLGPGAVLADDALGDAIAIDGADGRGASAWAPVVEWTLDAIATGVVGGAAWLGLCRAANRLQAIAESLWETEVRFNVSRGAAALLAIHHVRSQFQEQRPLHVEAVDEPSGLRGEPASELNYVGIEPWLVSLVDDEATKRYIVVVDPNGMILEAEFAHWRPADTMPVTRIGRVSHDASRQYSIRRR